MTFTPWVKNRVKIGFTDWIYRFSAVISAVEVLDALQ